uniref:Vesicle-associated membrane protein 7 n=1 Tax=Rhinolophus ferrumequinum TaxID=59479 RepID=A0A671DHW7_RHIFE
KCFYAYYVFFLTLRFISRNEINTQKAETFLWFLIDLVAQRGERLELLIDKTENLVDSSVTFKTTSRNLARAMCMKNLKLTIIIIIVSIVFIYIIVSPLCGGFTWPSCVKK